MKRMLLALAIPVALLLSACTGDGDSTLGQKDSTTRASATTSSETHTPTTTPSEPANADIYGVTPDGLTTAVNVPVFASVAEMAQGCIEAKAALNMFGGDVEVTLAIMQATAEDSTEGFTITTTENGWADATPDEQAAIIAALHAAANGEC